MDHSRDAERVTLTTVDLLMVDDIALEPMTKEESKDVYQRFLERTGRGSMIITSNRDTAEWLPMFDDVLIAKSAVDRFENAADDFVMEGEPAPNPAPVDVGVAEAVRAAGFASSRRCRRVGVRSCKKTR